MRIGIDYRILSAGFDIVHRGMGRYTQQQLREVLKIDSVNEYVLFCRPNADHSQILPEIKSASNVTIASIAHSDKDFNQTDNLLLATEQFQEQIYKHKLDIFHVPTLFLWHDIVMPHFDVCPLVVTFYDLIPLIFAKHYLPPQTRIQELYTRALNFTQRATRLIAISESARQDAINYLGISPKRIDVAYPIADPCFRRVPDEEIEINLRNLRKRVNIPVQFVMTVTHLHHSKNLETLLASYALLQPSVRRQIPLVVACHLSDAEKAYVHGLAESYGIADDVITTGFLAENELVALYNAATIVVHPSRYEGFGLPVLEALNCGAPVITTTSSSLPEVGGDAALLVDPDDKQGFATAIEALYSDPVRRDAMRQRGLAHAKKFEPRQLARNTLACYEQADGMCTNTQSASSPPRLALWTPLPPQQSGVADYSAELLRPLSQSYDIEIFVDEGYLPSIDLISQYTIHHYTAFERRRTQMPFDVIVYQLGASSFHLYMYEWLQKVPGIVVLHDLVWGYALYPHYYQARRSSDFKKELALLEGKDAAVEWEGIEQLPSEAFGPALEKFLNQHYMVKKIITRSLATVVHMDSAQQELETLYPNAKIHTVHMGVEDPWQGLPVSNLQFIREQLGLKASTFVVGIFGSIDPVKHLGVCIRAFHQLKLSYPDVKLIVVGDAFDSAYLSQLQALIQGLELHQHVQFAGHIAVTDPHNHKLFDRLLLACDVVVSLRHPSRKQMSGTLARTIAAGKPIIITDLPEWGFIPNDFCWRIPVGENEIDLLAQSLIRLASDPVLCKQMSVSAREYFEQDATVERMAERYQAIIKQITGPRLSVPSTQLKGNMSMQPLNFNRVCNLEDFSNPEMVDTIRDVFRHEIRHFTPEFPRGAEYRKYWEVAMSARAMRQFSVLNRNARILGVGAGTETTMFYLTNYVGQVFATDLYLASGIWDNFAPGFMLLEPEKVAPYAFERERLIVQHMDGRVLHYPDNTFDGIFSSGSIEHFGGLGFAANTAYEMGRVLKPGGILTLSTEYLISGPPGSTGWDGCILFSRDNLLRYIVDASGLELVDELDTTLDEDTLTSKRDLSMYIAESDAHMAHQGRYPRAGEIIWSKYPHLILVHQGHVFCSVHLALRKTENYPVKPNDWARPSQATIEAVNAINLRLANANLSSTQTPGTTQIEPMTMPTNIPTNDSQVKLRGPLKVWNTIRLRGWESAKLRRLPAKLGALGRVLLRVFTLGHLLDAQSQFYDALVEQLADRDRQLAAMITQTAELNAQVRQNTSQLDLVQRQADQQSKTDAHLADVETRLDHLLNRAKQVDARLEYLTGEIGQANAQLNSLAEQANARLEYLTGEIGQANAQLNSLAEQADARFKHLNDQVSELESRPRTAGQLAQLETHLAEVAMYCARLEEQVGQATSYMRLLQQQAEISQSQEGLGSPTFLSGQEIVEILKGVEQRLSELAACTAVELSFQDESAENALVFGATYLGDRMSSKGELYRSPNDAWYHIDFSSEWSRQILFESALARLTRGGKFIIITASDNFQPSGTDGLEMILNQILRLGSGKEVRVYIWRKP